MTDADFAKAIAGGAEAAQKTAQPAYAESGDESHTTKLAEDKTSVLISSAILCKTPLLWGVGDEGLEPPTSTV